MKFKDAIITRISSFIKPEKKETIAFAKLLRNLHGIEVGGPSQFFKQKSYYPAYLYARKIDGVNFNTNTVWEGSIEAGDHYNYLSGYPLGHQYIAEAASLNDVENVAYDFLLSCHSLEHIANPIKALKRWNEVLKPQAWFCLVLPNKECCFDINRPYTSFEHLMEDYNNNIGEDDETHFDEVLDLHVIELDKGVGSKEELVERTKKNISNRCVHHHVFSFDTIRKMLDYCGFDVVVQKKVHGINLFTLAKKR